MRVRAKLASASESLRLPSLASAAPLLAAASWLETPGSSTLGWCQDLVCRSPPLEGFLGEVFEGYRRVDAGVLPFQLFRLGRI